MNKVILAISLILIISNVVWAQEVPFTGTVTVEQSPGDLSLERMETLAEQHSDGAGIVWVGYQVTARETLRGLTNRGQTRWSRFHGYSNGRYMMPMEGKDDGIWVNVSPEKAVLYKFSGESGDLELSEVVLYDLGIDLEFTRPLVFLTPVDVQKSLDILQSAAPALEEDEREDLMIAIAIHDSGRALDMLEQFAMNDEYMDVREEAVTWFGMALSDDDFDKFDSLYSRLDKAGLREDAVFHFYRFNSPQATNRLLEIAENDQDDDVREQAFFWLGQRAGKRMAEKMGLNSDSDKALTSSQKAQIFALHQMDSSRGRQMLLRVAREGKTFGMRKQALFWLCNEPNEEVLSFLKELLK